MDFSLKALLLIVLDAAMTVVPGPIARTALGFIRWAVNKWVPNTVAAPAIPASATGGLTAAPDEMRNFVVALFDAAREHIKGTFYLRIYDAVVSMFEGAVLDKVWDALTAALSGQPTLMSAGPEFCAAAAEVDAAMTALSNV